MSDPKKFPIGALLSVSTERLCSPFDELHKLIEHLAGGPVWTHQLPDAQDALKPALLGQHPWLVGLVPPEPFDTEEIVCGWVREQADRFGAEHVVTVIEGGWSRNPITDLVDKMGADRVVPVIVPEGNPS
jgi:hypothetical protein